MSRSASSFGYVFWCLVSAIFLLAVAGSSAMVWWTSRPFLVDLQEQRLREGLDRNAMKLRGVIEQQHNLLTYLATEPHVVAYIIGDSEGEDSVADRLAALEGGRDVEAIRVYDFLGERVYPAAGDDDDGDEPPATAVLVAGVLAGHSSGQIPVLYSVQDGRQRLVIAAPARHHGLTEGVLTATVTLNSKTLFGGETVELRDTISSRAGRRAVPDDRLVARVAGTSLEVLAQPAPEEVAAAGRDLVWRNIVAVAMVLVAPFAALGLIGRSVLVMPHADLELSRDALREQQKELKELAAIAQAAEEAIIVTDLESRILWVNLSFERTSGYSAADVRGRVPGAFLQGANTSMESRQAIRAALDGRRSVQTELLNYSKAGDPYWISLSISPLLDNAGIAYGFMAVATDITEQKAHQDALAAANAEIERQALHDELTGLPNRRHFELEYQRRTADGGLITLIRIDLDHFKDVNDTHGHEAGDAVLREVGRILREETRSGDLPVRIGGDEFVVVMSDTEAAKADALAHRLQERIRRPIVIDGTPIRFGASFGIASSADRFVGSSSVLRAADAALYKAKDSGRNAICNYSESVHSEITSARRLTFQIRAAIDRGEFVPHYQPQFNARTRALAGVEVLGRWQHPERGLLLPATFLPTATQMSLISRIDAMLMRRAMQDMRDLAATGLVVPKISFNITADRLLDVETLVGAIDNPLVGTRIAFEILESVLLEDKADAIDLVFDLLRDYGISIEIDDFGSGHASIVSLMRMRPDALKLDQRLVHPLPESPRHLDLVASLINLAGSLGVSVTAEGVETQRHADLLADLGVHTLQGYHLAEPMPIEELVRFLAARSAPALAAGPVAEDAVAG